MMIQYNIFEHDADPGPFPAALHVQTACLNPIWSPILTAIIASQALILSMVDLVEMSVDFSM